MAVIDVCAQRNQFRVGQGVPIKTTARIHTLLWEKKEKSVLFFWVIFALTVIRPLLNLSFPPAYTLRLLLLSRLWWNIIFRNNK